MIRRFVPVSAAALVLLLACTPADSASQAASRKAPNPEVGRDQAARLPAPASGRIPVAFVITPGVTVIDFAGPWEVFQDVTLREPGVAGSRAAFSLFTVGPSREPVQGSGGLLIVPDYTFEDAPEAKIIVVAAQSGSDRMREWIRTASAKADLTMSVCTGAFHLAKAGLLDGRAATTHHDFLDEFERTFPQVKVRRNVRYVESSRIASAGGLTSGIDLALRVVARYFGEETAERTAVFMEHSSSGWHKDAGVWDDAPGAEAAPAGSP